MDDDSIHLELLCASRVESVSDEGLVILRLPDGTLCTASVPRRSIALVRRLIELDREREHERAGRRTS